MKYNKEGSGFPKFTVEIGVEAELLEKIRDVPYKELQSTLQQSLEDKIEKVYNKGLQEQMDLLNVGEKWFRLHPKEFNELEKKNSFYLTENSLEQLKVKVKIIHFNAYRYNKKQY